MINRRHQIKSALAERKMFANGGMVSPNMPQGGMMPPSGRVPAGILASSQPMVNAATPMGMQNAPAPLPTPQGMPNVPAGILALSPDTIDAATQDFLSAAGLPAGNPGPMPMAHGGLVASENMMAQGYADGGFTPGTFTETSLKNPTVQDQRKYTSALAEASALRKKVLDSSLPAGRAGPWERGYNYLSDIFGKGGLEAERAREERANDPAVIEYERLRMLPVDYWLEQVGADNQTREALSRVVPSRGTLGGLSRAPMDRYRFEDRQAEAKEMALGAAALRNTGFSSLDEFFEARDKEDAAAQAAATAGAPPRTREALLERQDRWDKEEQLLAAAAAAQEAEAIAEQAAEREDIDYPGDEGDQLLLAAKPGIQPVTPFQRSKDWGTLTRYLAGGGQKEAPAAVVNKAADDIFSTALKAAKGEKFNAETLKAEIDALLPKTKDDPEMKGLLMAMVGAAIMGGESPDAWVNIAQGITKSLPAFINFKGKQAEAERAREMTVAKLAIETKLSRETDNRANIRAIEREQRAATNVERVAARKEAAGIRKENRSTKMYTVLKTAEIPLKAIDPEAPEGEMFKIPALAAFPLNKAAAQRLSGLGVSIASGVTHSYKDLVEANTRISGISGYTSKQINEWTRNEKMTVFKYGTSPGAEIFFRTPRESGVRLGFATQDAMQPGMWKKLYSAFRTYQDPLMVLYGRFDTLKQYVNADGSLSDDGKSRVTGYNVILERLGDKLTGMGFGWSRNLGKALLGGKTQSTISKFEAEARIVLAQIAPLYLGESGRTISDADRIRVALALGFRVDQDLAGQANPILKIIGFDDAFFTSPGVIENALNVTQGIVRKYIDQGNNEMGGYLNQFARVLDTTPKLKRDIPLPRDPLVFNATR